MASLINAPTTILSSVSPSSLGGNAADYQEKINGGAKREGAKREGAQQEGAQREGAQHEGAQREGAQREGAQHEGETAQRGGQGYGYEGKEIAPGKMEFSSYKGGKKRQSKRQSKSKRRNQSKRQRKQNKSRRR